MNFRKLNIPKIHPDSWHETPDLQNHLKSLYVVFSFLIIKGSFATDHQLYAPTASSSHHMLLDSWKERQSLLISWCPEAQLSLFLLVKLLLLISRCFSHPSLFTLSPSSSHSHIIPRFASVASGQTMNLFVYMINVCLWHCVVSV